MSLHGQFTTHDAREMSTDVFHCYAAPDGTCLCSIPLLH